MGFIPATFSAQKKLSRRWKIIPVSVPNKFGWQKANCRNGVKQSRNGIDCCRPAEKSIRHSRIEIHNLENAQNFFPAARRMVSRRAQNWRLFCRGADDGI